VASPQRTRSLCEFAQIVYNFRGLSFRETSKMVDVLLVVIEALEALLDECEAEGEWRTTRKTLGALIKVLLQSLPATS
jgi:hypothetical protein